MRRRSERPQLDVTPEPIQKTVLRVEIINRLRKMVRSNGLKPGTRLPSEPALATMLGVSRPSLREALTVLETLGVLEVRRGVGAFVKDPSAAALDSSGLPRLSGAVEERELELLAVVLHRVRLAVEPVAASLAAERATAAELDRLKAELERLTAAAQTRDIIEAAAADVAFHNVILEASHSPLLASIVGALEKPLRQTREITLGSYWNEAWVVRTHTEIFTAIREHRPDAAQQAMTRHLQAVEKLVRTIDWTARKQGKRRQRRRARPEHRR
jgi:GntR family transcriptional repressor for pyruvate dehydrogenase complex